MNKSADESRCSLGSIKTIKNTSTHTRYVELYRYHIMPIILIARIADYLNSQYQVDYFGICLVKMFAQKHRQQCKHVFCHLHFP